MLPLVGWDPAVQRLRARLWLFEDRVIRMRIGLAAAMTMAGLFSGAVAAQDGPHRAGSPDDLLAYANTFSRCAAYWQVRADVERNQEIFAAIEASRQAAEAARVVAAWSLAKRQQTLFPNDASAPLLEFAGEVDGIAAGERRRLQQLIDGGQGVAFVESGKLCVDLLPSQEELIAVIRAETPP